MPTAFTMEQQEDIREKLFRAGIRLSGRSAGGLPCTYDRVSAGMGHQSEDDRRTACTFGRFCPGAMSEKQADHPAESDRKCSRRISPPLSRQRSGCHWTPRMGRES